MEYQSLSKVSLGSYLFDLQLQTSNVKSKIIGISITECNLLSLSAMFGDVDATC